MAESKLKLRVADEMKEAMKSKDKDRLTFVRNLHAAIRKKEIDDRVDLDDAGVRKIVSTALKQRRESLEQFEKGGRADLVAVEKAEIDFLQSFLPAQLDDDVVKRIIDETVSQTQAKDIKDMGKVMQALLPKIEGQADAKQVSQWVRERLSQKTG